MISVVITTYNGERFLRKQLDSIWSQTRKPDEIIISDDNSSDTTRLIIQSYIEKGLMPIKFFHNNERLGYASNFRKALLLAKGDIIFLSDQDDIWHKRKIEICEGFFNTHVDALALSTAFEIIDDNGRKSRKGIFYTKFSLTKVKKIKWKTFLRHPKYPGMAMVVKKDLIDKIDFNRNWKELPHDWQLNQEAAHRNSMYFLNIALTQYRQHQSNTVGTLINVSNDSAIIKRVKMLENICNALQMIADDYGTEKPYINKSIRYQKERRKLCLENRYIYLFFYSVLNLNYISIRSIFGDLYVGIQYSKVKKIISQGESRT